MDHDDEDTYLAPTESIAGEKSKSPNFLQDTTYGAMIVNVISNYVSDISSFVCIYCVWPILLKVWHDKRKRDAALQKRREEVLVRNREIEGQLDHHSVPIDELDASPRHEQPDNWTSEGNSKLVRCRKPSRSSLCRKDEEIPADEGSCSALTEKERCIGGEITTDDCSTSVPAAKEQCKDLEITPDEVTSSTLVAVEQSIDPELPSHEIEVNIKCYFKKETLKAINLKDVMKGIGAQAVKILPGSRIVETSVRVRLDEDLLRKACSTVKEGAKIDKAFTLQIEDWGIYYYEDNHSTEEGVKLLRLQDSQVLVPTILSAEYAAGVLRIYGLHLEKAQIKVATSSKSKKLTMVTHEKICGGKIDMLTFKDLLPEMNFRNLYVYAIIPVQVDPTIEGGRVVNVLSSSVMIDDIHLKKALRDWLPTIVIVIFVARQLWLSMKPLWEAACAFYSKIYWTVPMLIIIFCTMLLPPRTEQWITDKLGSLCFVLSRLKMYVGSLGCSGLDSQENFQVQENHDVQKKEVLRVKTKNSKPSRRRHRARDILNDVLDSDSDMDSESKLADDDEEELDSETETAETIEVEGKNALVTPLEWEWKSYDLVYDQRGLSVRKKRTPVIDVDQDGSMDPFSVIYDNRSEPPLPNRVYVHMKSKVLLGVLEKLMPNTKQSYVDLGMKGGELFLSFDKLKDELTKLTDEVTDRDDGTHTRAGHQLQRHLHHLIRFLEKEYADTSTRYERMNRQGCVSWDMLWTFLIPGEEVVYKSENSEEEVCGIVHEAEYMGRCLVVGLSVYNYNCKTFEQYANLDRSINLFEGDRAFHALDVYPLRFSGKPDISEKHFLSQGSTFGYLSTQARCRYMHYKGITFSYVQVNNWPQMVKETAVGRVMIDLSSFWRMNPDCPLGNAEPPCDVIFDNKVTEIDISENPNRKFAPCIVYGFSFRLKKWGAFSVCGFDEIKYNVQAWDELVMDRDLKMMTEGLVTEHLRKEIIPDNQGPAGLDTISCKGDSCIVLCYGPPGTGKTLTAEALADKHKAPLWAMSVSELGITPDQLDSRLVDILEVAHSWHALLLLDEADVYLEKRSDGSDLARNAMTGIFLRRIEYYKGVLFLTTNRSSTFDDAFRSRITLFLHYKALDADQRKLIWRNFLSRDKLAPVEIDHIVEQVCDFQLNGRQIRSVLNNVQKLARLSTQPFGNIVIKTAKLMNDSSANIDIGGGYSPNRNP